MCYGVVILDTSCFKHLVDRETFEQVRGGFRASGLAPWISATNVVEVAASHPKKREALEPVLRQLLDDRPILPPPHVILQGVGEAITRGERSFTIHEGSADRLLANPQLAARYRQRLASDAAKLEEAVSKAFDRHKEKLRREIKKRDLWHEWPTLGEFLEAQWMTDDMTGFLVPDLWQVLGLQPPAPPAADVLEHDAWRLFVAVIGAMTYFRSVVKEVPRPTHFMDAMQLVYMAASRPSVLVTGDKPFRDFARDLLSRRHPLTRVLYIDELLALR